MIRLFILFIFSIIVTDIHSQEYRTISGTGNNQANPEMGALGAVLPRYTSDNYADGSQEINDLDLPLPREISNKLFDQGSDLLEQQSLSDYVWLFGQFLDHDISLVENDDHQATRLLEIPEDDEFFDDNTKIELVRNAYMPGTGEGINNPRQYANQVTSFIDASQVYGSTQDKADWLRTFEDGKLKTAKNTGNTKDLLPWNTISGEFNDDIDYSEAAFMADDTRSLSKYFVAGDVRANENPLLIAIHTLFVREHNRLCDEIKDKYPNLSDENIYQRARKFVGAYLQAITYYEWLPSLGVYLPDYQGYSSEVNPAVMNVFSAAAFRIGHTLIDDDIIRMDNEGNIIPAGNLKLKDSFFKPYSIVNANGLDPYFKGMGTEIMQEMDCKMIGDLRNFLFAGSGHGLDLASINIFRGRDRGLADYNTLRVDLGLTQLRTFEDFTDNEEDARILEELYGDVDKIDAWVGMLSEPHVDDNAVLGELVMAIIKKQFKFLRDGDRFYFENDNAFTPAEIATIKKTTLHDIIMRNTGITLMQPNVFSAMPHMDIPNLVLNEIPLEAVVYPNPVSTSAVVKIYSEEDEELASYKLYNALGNLVMEGEIQLYQGQDNYLELDLSGQFSKGNYSLLLQSDSKYKILKLLKL